MSDPNARERDLNDFRDWICAITESGAAWIGKVQGDELSLDYARFTGEAVRLCPAYRHTSQLVPTPQGLGWLRGFATVEISSGLPSVQINEVVVHAVAIQRIGEMSAEQRRELRRNLDAADAERLQYRAQASGIEIAGRGRA